MRCCALLLLALTGCTLDPQSVIDKAALRVQVEGIPFGSQLLVLTARDSKANQLVKRAPIQGQRTVELVFEKDALAPGAVDLGAVATDAAGKQLACGSAHADATGMSVTLTLTLANDKANCGGCGVACDDPPNSTRGCDLTSLSCGAVVCQSGWFDVDKNPVNGCETNCAAPSAEDSTVTCKDGVDNDCDGKKDCADPGCSGLVRSCSFGTCTGSQTWDCATDLWSACTANQGLENDVATCSDGIDNDCDGKKDCADPSCTGFTRSCTVQTCSGTQSWTCSTASWSACAIDPLLEATIAACSDGLDNDCDGKKDCQDPDCLNIKQGCGVDICAAGVKTWLCNVNLFSLCVPYVSVPENSDLVCGDGLDNDCDSKTDCQDPDCAGKRCAAGKVCCASGNCSATCP